MTLSLLFFGAVAGIAAVFLVDRFFRARTERLRDTGLLPPAGQGTAADVERLIRERRKIGAIKLYREIHGVGLKEAKEAVESLTTRMAGEGSAGAIEPYVPFSSV